MLVEYREQVADQRDVELQRERRRRPQRNSHIARAEREQSRQCGAGLGAQLVDDKLRVAATAMRARRGEPEK